jgi:hypothetical protein
MKEYTVFVTGMRGNERLNAIVSQSAESAQAAIVAIASLPSSGFKWYSWTYREDVGYDSDVKIVAYEVGCPS